MPARPGYGNFCFGHFNATAVEKATPNDSANPTQYTVTYQFEVLGIPEWVRKPESMRAFPKLAGDTAIQSATATLSKGADGEMDSRFSPIRAIADGESIPGDQREASSLNFG